MTDHDKATPHEELLARLDRARTNWMPQSDVLALFLDTAAAIRDLQAKLEAERKAREQLIDDFDLLASDAEALEKERQRATAAEQALARCFEETRDKIKDQLCDQCKKKLETILG